MGVTKRIMEREQDQLKVATDIAVEAGVLTCCEFHGEVYDAQAGDNTPAYARGKRLFTAGELNGVFSDRREMADAIQTAIQGSGIECYSCAKWRSE